MSGKLTKAQVQEILKKEFSEQEIARNRKDLVENNPNRTPRKTIRPSNTETFERFDYTVKSCNDMTIHIYRNLSKIKISIWINQSFFNKRDWSNKIHVKDNNIDVKISFTNKGGFNGCHRKGFYVIESMYHDFPNDVHMMGEYEAQPDSVRIRRTNTYAVKMDVIVGKRLYIPNTANASYSNMMQRRKRNGKGPLVGYVSNRNKADFEHTNINKPFQGGRVNPR